MEEAMQDPHDRLFSILLDKNAITWQTIIQELVKSEEMDPWDIDVSILSKRYIDMLKKLKEMDFKVSGKVVLAAAILLRIKSTKLVTEDIGELDSLMAGEQESYDDFYDELQSDLALEAREQIMPLLPRTPQPRKRKVSIYDLMLALQKALEVKERRVLRGIPSVKIDVPERKIELGALINDVYRRVVEFLTNRQRLTFSELLRSQDKADKVMTFIPLLHLAHIDQRKLDLLQKEQFGEIEIVLHEKQVIG
ncbi:MAG: segregation/condensation protein A [Candidatus Woesearchaeota archaeon]